MRVAYKSKRARGVGEIGNIVHGVREKEGGAGSA